jgi:hypothetical protein
MGMSAKQMDSDRDVKLITEAMGSPSFDINVAYSIISTLRKRMAEKQGVGQSSASSTDDDIRKEFGLSTP